MNDDVSILVTTKNGAGVLPYCLERLERHAPGIPLRVLVDVTDSQYCSYQKDDRSREWLDRAGVPWFAYDPWRTWRVVEPFWEYTCAVQQALEHVPERFLVVLDHDTFVLSDEYIAYGVGRLRDEPELIIAGELEKRQFDTARILPRISTWAFFLDVGLLRERGLVFGHLAPTPEYRRLLAQMEEHVASHELDRLGDDGAMFLWSLQEAGLRALDLGPHMGRMQLPGPLRLPYNRVLCRWYLHVAAVSYAGDPEKVERELRTLRAVIGDPIA